MSSRTLKAIGLAACLAIVGCSADAHDASGGRGSAGTANGSAASVSTGSVGMQLTLPAGQSIELVEWAITGPNGASTTVQTGTAQSQSTGLNFLISNIPSGSDYLIALSGVSDDGSVTCTGSARFNVTARVTTPVSVLLTCGVSSAGAHVTRINGTSYNCAAWNDVSANPTQTAVGSSVMLTASASAPVPSSITYAWSAPSGSFGNATAANTTFTCTDQGVVPVTLTVADGPVPAGDSCSTSLTTTMLTITCGAMQIPPAPAMPPWALGVAFFALLGLGTIVSQRRTSV